MRRRSFLMRGLAAAGSLFVVASCRRQESLPQAQGGELVSAFEQHFSYLKLDRKGLERFLVDYQEAFGSLLLNGAPRPNLPYLKYLESTDFFLNGADESQVVRYILLRDPYLNPCFNPFPVS